MFTFVRSIAFAAVCVAAASAFAAASATPKVTLTLSDALVTTPNGTAVAGPVDRPVKAGDLLRYTIIAKNVGTAAAYAFAPIGQIPEHTGFVRVLTAPPSAVLYTLDGKTWSSKPTVTVVGKDGKKIVKPAAPDLYRAIRWQLSKPLAASASDRFVYEVRVK